MNTITRRNLVKGGTALAAGAALTGPALLEWAKAWAQTTQWKPEAGAHLSMLRWKYFVQSEDDSFMALLSAFEKATGCKVEVTRESYEDVTPKASVAANTGAGPDLFWGLYSLPHLFPQKCLDVTDVADYLGKKYGGWVPAAVAYGKSGNKWIDIPICINGNMPNYRISSMKKAGFSKFPATTDEFLEYAKATKKNNTPGGFALGHASGDGNAWVHWCLWAHGGNLVDKDDKVIIDSPETAKALEYGKQLYENMIPGVASWNDASNNKAFLAGEIHWTGNGISIYVAAQNDPTKKDLAEDIDHAVWPVGPVGRPTELALAFPMLAMGYSKYPQACKALMAYLLEADQFNKWLQDSKGYLTHALNAYDANPVWTSDPKRTVFREAGKRTLTAGGLGSVGEKAASALADFLVLDMFASYCTGREDLKNAIRIADRQARRLYR
ncbi:MAG TPA: extracellular solute-binding protein [Xanthobacteraceae bacterium]|jgi:multiple sugar transport system substrate-binding protein|nr:extracellular solute-binding protein [Xanthobacteraceae bacterium]